MIIENAERFGLAQLHQLRGSVGRGKHKSYCILIYNSKQKFVEKECQLWKKLHDGFKISAKRFRNKRTRRIFWNKTTWIARIKVANIFKHMKILKLAQLEARYIIG